ncbi:MAG: hypothetical protein KC636_08830 [Myxococcales bacterium]|nr:hypothetical protein [Myxococcales bacterium]
MDEVALDPAGDPPDGCSWGRYLDLLVREHGGLAPLVDLLQRRAGDTIELPDDPQSIERGLRRLGRRGNAPGGQYGRWLLRFFGVPAPLAETARWMGQYHSRFADLPVSLRAAQLWRWDRPPICESSVAAWIHLGLASIAMRRADRTTARHRLERSRASAATIGPAALAEAELLAARLASDELDDPKDRLTAVAESLARAAARVDEIDDPDERACYLARVLDQQAYAALHPGPGAPRRVDAALERYAAIPADCPVPFVQFRRNHGLAYCRWKLGDRPAAIAHARAACTHAGDGGLVRFRIMALDLLAHLTGDPEAAALRDRAVRLARQLEHEDLLAAMLPNEDA